MIPRRASSEVGIAVCVSMGMYKKQICDILEGEVFDSTIRAKSVIGEGLDALGWDSRNSLTANLESNEAC